MPAVREDALLGWNGPLMPVLHSQVRSAIQRMKEKKKALSFTVGAGGSGFWCRPFFLAHLPPLKSTVQAANLPRHCCSSTNAFQMDGGDSLPLPPVF